MIYLIYRKNINYNERMGKMPNVKTLLIKLMFFFTGIALLIVVSILNSFNLISPTSYVINSVLLAVSIGASVVCFIMHKKLMKISVHVIDIIISVVLFLFIYLIYLIPPLGFYGLLGVNNSIIMLFVFVLGAMYFGEIAAVLERKNTERRNNAPKKSLVNTRQGKPDRPKISIQIGITGSLASRYNGDGIMPNENVFKVMSVILFVIPLLVAIVNVIYPIIDMSIIIPN